MDIDWVAIYGASLSTALAIAGLFRWVRDKTEERAGRTKALLEGIYGPIRTLDDNFDGQNITNLVEELRPYRSTILALEPILRKSVPKISANLAELIALIMKLTHDRFELYNMGVWGQLQNEPRTKTLVSALRMDIEKWLSAQA